MDDDQRRTSRLEVNYPATMRSSEGTTRGEVKNLSSGGAYLDCEKPLAPGEIFDMSIHIPGKAKPSSTKAQVVWSISHGMGVEFLHESNWKNPKDMPSCDRGESIFLIIIHPRPLIFEAFSSTLFCVK